MTYQLKYKQFGGHAILIEWPSRIDESIFFDTLAFKKEIELQSNKNIKTIISAYNSLLVVYHTVKKIEFNKEIIHLKSCYYKKKRVTFKAQRVWRVPVCYDVSFGIDLKAISIKKKISIEELIKRHSERPYLIYFKGFLPGFMYLGGLDPILFQARKSKPRLKIKKGAVAIGGEQTGVYPIESPGGWNIIGNSPINFFDIKKEKPCFASNGDYIQFYSITKKHYHDIKTLVDNDVYQLESKKL